MKTQLFQLREMFRDWYGTLSVEELVENRKLIKKIERLERMLSAMVA